jgi:hypothetical protein
MKQTDHSKFAAFILTHGRPDDVITYKVLRRHGYTGDIYIIIDDEDETASQYVARFGSDRVITVNLKEAAKSVDIGDSMQHHNSVVYKRQAAFGIAERLGLDYFMQLDDDYLNITWRYLPEPDRIGWHFMQSLDEVITAMIKFLDASGAASIAWAQGGDYIGGVGSQGARKPLLRKCMNSWLCRTDRPVNFVSRLNDDVNTYLLNGTRGDIFFTVSCITLAQVMTQQAKGGMTELYLNTGTYMKSMYSVMMSPSNVKVRIMGETAKRLHHHIRWDHAVPKIISDQHRKKR